jgi:hypothetical protein
MRPIAPVTRSPGLITETGQNQLAAVHAELVRRHHLYARPSSIISIVLAREVSVEPVESVDT